MFLSGLGGLDSPPGLTVLATTNRPQDLDRAFISRFSRFHLFELPNPSTRYNYFISELKKKKGHHTLLNIKDFSRLNTDFFSYRELTNLISCAIDKVGSLLKGYFYN